MAKSKHVVPKSTGGWDVKNGGSDKATKHFETKQPAVDYARELAKKQGQSLEFLMKMVRLAKGFTWQLPLST